MQKDIPVGLHRAVLRRSRLCFRTTCARTFGAKITQTLSTHAGQNMHDA